LVERVVEFNEEEWGDTKPSAVEKQKSLDSIIDSIVGPERKHPPEA